MFWELQPGPLHQRPACSGNGRSAASNLMILKTFLVLGLFKSPSFRKFLAKKVECLASRFHQWTNFFRYFGNFVCGSSNFKGYSGVDAPNQHLQPSGNPPSDPSTWSPDDPSKNPSFSQGNLFQRSDEIHRNPPQQNSFASTLQATALHSKYQTSSFPKPPGKAPSII